MSKTDAPEAPEQLWTARDVARFFNASKSWVYQQAEAGTLPCLKIGGLLRFSPRVIREFALGSPPIVRPAREGM